MRVRGYTERDLERLKELHRQQGIEYEFPEINKPIFFSKQVLERNGEVVAALIARCTAEMFFLMGKFGTPQERWEGFLKLHAASEVDVWNKGAEDVHAWLPPEMARFGRRLESIGWRRQLWPCYAKVLFEGIPTDEVDLETVGAT